MKHLQTLEKLPMISISNRLPSGLLVWITTKDTKRTKNEIIRYWPLRGLCALCGNKNMRPKGTVTREQFHV
jgi:hypothetical protein